MRTYRVVLNQRVLWTAGGLTRGPAENPAAEGHRDQKAKQSQQLLHAPQQVSSLD